MKPRTLHNRKGNGLRKETHKNAFSSIKTHQVETMIITTVKDVKCVTISHLLMKSMSVKIVMD